MPLQPEYLDDIRHKIAIATYSHWRCSEDKDKIDNSNPYETPYVSSRAFVGSHSPPIWEAGGIVLRLSLILHPISVQDRASGHSTCHSRSRLGAPRCEWKSISLGDCVAFSSYTHTNGKEIFLTRRKPGRHILNFHCLQVGPVQGVYNRLAFPI